MRIDYHINAMSYFLNKHKYSQLFSFSRMRVLLSEIDYLSAGVCISLLLVSFAQVVMVRSLFTGYISLKIWKNS